MKRRGFLATLAALFVYPKSTITTPLPELLGKQYNEYGQLVHYWNPEACRWEIPRPGAGVSYVSKEEMLACLDRKGL